MDPSDTEFKIEAGYLKGPSGIFELSDIDVIYAKPGGRLSPAMFLVFIAGIAAIPSVVMWVGASLLFIPLLAAAPVVYLAHASFCVYVVVGGREIGLLAEVYYPGIWGEARAKARCDALVKLVSSAKSA